MNHPVHSPSHYTKGRIEAIDIIEDVVSGAPEPVVGYLIGQTLKYILRAWYKGNVRQDLQKASWYLERAIHTLQD